MDPDFYKKYTAFQGRRAPVFPPEDSSQGNDDTAKGQVQQNSDWTVENPDVFRTRAGWGPAKNKPGHPAWMSTENQQPYMPFNMDMSSDEVEDAPTPHAITQNQNHAFPHPGLSLPFPELKLEFRMAATLNPLISVGPTPSGQRNWISISGGRWSGSFGSGTVIPGGQDSQIIHPNGAAELSAHYLLQTSDTPPAYIVVKSRGWRTGPPEILAALRDPERASGIDPRSYKFRVCVTMETGDERYGEKVNYAMWIGSGMRKANEVIYDAYRVQ